MATIQDVLIEIQRCISVGRSSLADRGITTSENIKMDEIMEKISDIPIYSFNKTIDSTVEISTTPTHNITINGTFSSEIISATTTETIDA